MVALFKLMGRRFDIVCSSHSSNMVELSVILASARVCARVEWRVDRGALLRPNFKKFSRTFI